MIPVVEFKVGEVPSVSEGIRRSIATFGQYAGLTYEQILENDPEYCQWHLDNFLEEDEAGKAFADWLQKEQRLARKRKAVEDAAEFEEEEESLDAKRARVMEFGKYRDQDLTWGVIVDSYPGYCQTLLEKQDGKPVKQHIRRFLNFLKETGVDFNERIREQREKRRNENTSRVPLHAT